MVSIMNQLDMLAPAIAAGGLFPVLKNVYSELDNVKSI